MSEQLSIFEAQAERDRVLGALASNRGAYLAGLRAFAREHALRHGECCIDDVRDAAEKHGYPMPAELGFDERVMGAVFKTRDFVAVGARRTTRAAFAARVGISRSAVTVYRLVDVGKVN